MAQIRGARKTPLPPTIATTENLLLYELGEGGWQGCLAELPLKRRSGLPWL